jgi:hypothetical protein
VRIYSARGPIPISTSSPRLYNEHGWPLKQLRVLVRARVAEWRGDPCGSYTSRFVRKGLATSMGGSGEVVGGGACTALGWWGQRCTSDSLPFPWAQQASPPLLNLPIPKKPTCVSPCSCPWAGWGRSTSSSASGSRTNSQTTYEPQIASQTRNTF